MTRVHDEGGYWFDARPLSGSGLGRLRLPTRSRSGAIEEFARANRLAYAASTQPEERDLPGLLLTGECKDVVATTVEPRVEFGNHGWRFWVGSDDLVPSRLGYIAVRHGLDLPHVLVDFAGVLGAATPLNVASAALTALSIFDEDKTEADQSPIARFKHRSERVDLPDGAGLTAHGEKGRIDEAAAVLSTDALPILADLAGSFAVEIRDGWLIVYSFYGDVSTQDPEVWAWVFSSASRMLDLVGLWETTRVAAGSAHRHEPGFYTERRVERPTKLDGALRFLKRGK